MNGRTVIRSMVLPNGIVVAMDDGLISWRPNQGRRANIKLQYPATVLLAAIGHSDQFDKIMVGDLCGNVTTLTLPRLELDKVSEINDCAIKSLCLFSKSSDKLVIGDANGTVWITGDDVPGNKIKLFEHNEKITSIRCEGDKIIVQTGWSKFYYDWEGNQTDFSDKNTLFEKKHNERSNRRSRLMQSKLQKNPHSAIMDLPVIG